MNHYWPYIWIIGPDTKPIYALPFSNDQTIIIKWGKRHNSSRQMHKEREQLIS